MHDLWFSVPQFGLRFKETPDGFSMAGSLDEAIQKRDEFLDLNPNMLFIADIRMRSYALDEFPEDWSYWIKDSDGNIVNAWEGVFGLIDFTHPDIQDRIVQQAIAISKCGLYDGIHFDWWNEHGAVLAELYGDWSHKYRGNEAEQRARDNILRRIRAGARPDFLIMGNTNRNTIPRTSPHINGGFMETLIPRTATGNYLEALLNEVETSLLWLEQNLREPQVNALEGWGIPTKSPDDLTNLRWMRAFTTLSLTHSNGYVLFNLGEGHEHVWYEFWDADLGQPVGLTAQLYEEIPGLYLREYTNGWAVYNHSGETQTIALPEVVTGVSSEVEGMTHTLPNLDGEMYLKATPANPADVNGDGVVNILDLMLVAQGFGADKKGIDVNGDGVVNVFDLVFVA
ncbi:MAG: dockerin type I repeat-containing protein, partial [Candidatus Poribacteria bacterium]|nr:dockerin type I repeat-containing protein [Candidatus Poribacteria bacterium]